MKLREHIDEYSAQASVQALNQEAWDLCFCETDRALELSRHARERAEETGDRSGLAGSLLNIGLCNYIAGDYRDAVAVLCQALTLAEEVGDRLTQAHVLNWLGNTHWRLNDYDNSLALHRRSMSLRAEIGDKRGEASSLNNIGLNYYDMGKYDVALDYHTRSQVLYEMLEDREGTALALNNIANVYCKLGEDEQSLEYHRRSLDLKRAAGNRLGEAGSLTNIGNALRRLKDFSQALEYHHRSHAIARELNNRPGAALSLLNLGSVHEDLSQVRLALECYTSSLTTFDEIGDRYYGTIAHIGIAKVLSQMDQPKEALTHLESALQIAEEIASTELLYQAHECLASYFEHRADAASALRHLRASMRYREAMHGVEAEHRMMRLMIKAESERALHEAELYRLMHMELTRAYHELQHAAAQKDELLEQLRLKSQDLERLTLVDSLTGVSNRRHLEGQLQYEFERSRRLGESMTVVMIDIDDFKRVNDLFSHLVGDTTLRVVARVLQTCIRSIDIVGRYGGEEFLVILVETPACAATDICHRLCQAIRDYDWRTVHPEASDITISVGFCGDPGIDTPVGLVEAADRRMYIAKRNGKDRACGRD